MNQDTLLILVIVFGLLLVLLLVLIVMALMRIGQLDGGQQAQQTQQQLASNQLMTALDEGFDKSFVFHTQQNQSLREHTGQLAQTQREEISSNIHHQQQLMGQQLGQNASQLLSQLATLTETTERRLNHLRDNIEQRLATIEQSNAKKLDEMRHTVDEKLQATLEQRLNDSFKLVSERLEQVQRGLGEMQQLANGVGDLKRVLTNVKTRGTWGEMQLANLLEQVLTADKYAANVRTVPDSTHSVEFAIKLPGRGGEHDIVWLPIDAKFPKEQFERIGDAQDAADAEGVEKARLELVRHIKMEAKSISEKYVSPPHTTDFAIMFLPTEGLYAEVTRQAGLLDTLQREYRIVVAGPTTLAALLNSLQMGFRTLAMEKRASDVWQVLGAVKTEFNKFGDVLSKTRERLERAAKDIESAQTRSRQMTRALRNVEAIDGARSPELLGLDDMLALDGEPTDASAQQ